MRLCFLLFLIILVTAELNAQTEVFIPPLEAGELAFDRGDYRASLLHFTKALKKDRGTVLDWFKGAAAAVEAGGKSDVRKMVGRAFQQGLLEAIIEYDTCQLFDKYRFGIMDRAVENEIDLLLREYPQGGGQKAGLVTNNLHSSFVDDGHYRSLISYAIRAHEGSYYYFAFGLYRRALKINNASCRSLLRAAACAAEIGERDYAKMYMEEAFAEAPSTALNCLRLDLLLRKNFAKPAFSNFVGQEITRQFPGLDQVLVSEIDDIWADYTKYRTPETMENISNNPSAHYIEPFREDWKELQASWDTLCIRRITNIFDHAGYPSEALVADRRILPVLLLRVAPMEVWEEYDELLMDALNAGVFDPYHYAMSYDYARIRNGLPQKFATLAFKESSFKKGFNALNWPIEDPSNLDQRRASIGLPSINNRKRSIGMNGDFAAKMNRGELPKLGLIPVILTAPFPNHPK